VYRLAAELPHLSFELNGQLKSLSQVEDVLRKGLVRGCMVGRAAFHTPWEFADADRRLAGQPNPGLSRREVVAQYAEYADREWAERKAQLESDMRAAHPSASEHALNHWLKPRLSRLREVLYQAVMHLFAGCSSSAEYVKRLERSMERKMPLSKGVLHALKALSDEEADFRYI